jgi:hypothetical protein
MSKDMAEATLIPEFSGVAMKLLTRCGMISGAGSLDTAKARFARGVSPAPEATCNQGSVIGTGLANAWRKRAVSGDCINPVSERNRIKELFGSDLSVPNTPAGLSRVSRADVEAALAKAGVGVKELNLFEIFNV